MYYRHLFLKGRVNIVKNPDLKYFLAANSCEGFVSSFTEAYKSRDDRRVYIIKGGPGTGKSSFMKYLAKTAAARNLKVELCPCSSDPDSLDAVILPEKGIVVLDGTAPHTVDPDYPGVCEEILNFGVFWKKEVLAEKKAKILEYTDENKALHRSAAKFNAAAGQILSDDLKIAAPCANKEKAEAFANRLCKKYISSKSGAGSEQSRYLCGITPKGVVSFADTALKAAKTRIIIEDRYGVVSDAIMRVIRSRALSSGYDVITVKNAFLPSKLIDHIIIPELSTAFLREYEFQHFDCDNRRIHARRFMSAKRLSKSGERLRFNKKLTRELLGGATSALKEAKAVHDMLEENYISAMDFEALDAFAKEFANEVLK